MTVALIGTRRETWNGFRDLGVDFKFGQLESGPDELFVVMVPGLKPF